MVNGHDKSTRGDQLWAPEAMEIYMKGGGSEPDLLPYQIARLEQQESLQSLASTMGSWNIPQMRQMARLWRNPKNEEIYYDIKNWIEDQIYCDGAELSNYFTGSETLSPDYWPLQWGVVMGFDLWLAKYKSGKGIQVRCNNYYCSALKLCQLLSHVSDSRIFISPIGERTNQWSDSNLNAIYEVFMSQEYLSLGFNPQKRNASNSKTFTRGIDWPVRLARRVQHPSIADINAVAIPPLWSEIRRGEWSDGTICTYLVQMQNHNTLSYLCEVWRPDGSRELIYPWPEGRAFGVHGEAHVSANGKGNNLDVVYRVNDDDEQTIEVKLPENTPVKSFAIGQRGYIDREWKG